MRVSLLALAAPLLLPFVHTAGLRSGPSFSHVQGAAPSASASDTGMATYRNDTLHLTYRYPSTFTDASAVAGPAFQSSLENDPSTAGAAKCITLPFSRSDVSGGELAFVLLVRADAGCLKKKFDATSLPEVTLGEAQGLKASGAKTDFGKPVSFQTSGHPATLVKGSFVLPTGQALDAMIVCVLDQPDIACWQFLAAVPQKLKTMGAFPVDFDGSPAGPLVPAALLTAP